MNLKKRQKRFTSLQKLLYTFKTETKQKTINSMINSPLMQKPLHSVLLTVSIGLLTIIGYGCGKDDPIPALTKTQLLSQKAWVMTSLEDKVNGVWVKDNQIPAYELDDQYVFRANGTFEVNEGATKRSSTDPQIIGTSTWKFIDNESKIQIASGDLLNVVTLSETAFQFTSPAGTDDERYTFAHP